ncbi:MAG TPA: ABC transporter permease [Bacillales bacterium]|nr:ABC transporter permease [Bacillales bacterium]
MTLMHTFIDRREQIWVAVQQHLYMSVFAIVLATVISIPLAVFLSRKRKFAEPIITITALFQTIPSLALLAFIITIMGIGETSAIVALTIYALLPILRNTYTGLVGVDESAIEAGRGMGMTNNQILFKIRFRLALPVIMAGLRTATVITIGVTTLAAFIGAGGLGTIINIGLGTLRADLILAGAIPAALLALIFDGLLRWFEKIATPKGIRKNS